MEEKYFNKEKYRLKGKIKCAIDKTVSDGTCLIWRFLTERGSTVMSTKVDGNKIDFT